MGAVSSLIINTLYQFSLTLKLLGVCLKLAFAAFLQTRPHPTGDSLHPHPADTPDALSLVPRACCFPPSGGQNADAAL